MLYDYFGQQIVPKRRRFRFKMPVKLLDATLMTVPLESFDWAHYTKAKGAVKANTLLDNDTLLPEYVCITDGKVSDNRSARKILCR